MKISEVKEKLRKISEPRLIAISCRQDSDMFRIYYHFDDKSHKVHEMVVEASLKDPVVGTISDEYPAANVFEREVWEFFGVNFEGNKNLSERLFLPEGFKKHPLRK